MHRKAILYEKSKRLFGKKIGLCVTGSISAVETVKLARELQRHGADVTAIMSEGAKEILHPNALEFATGNKVIDNITGKIEHIGLAGNTKTRLDLVLVCPCTLNTMAKIASAVADTPPTLIVATALSHIPVMIVPAMHLSMYEHPAVAKHAAVLKSWDVALLQPKASEKKAKLPSVDSIVYEVIKRLSRKDLNGKKALVAAGPTIEEIDDVRFITNKSSGKMGIALAEEMEIRGADVKLVLGKTPCTTHVSKVVMRETYCDMYNEIIGGDDYDIYVLAVAASDFRPEKTTGKIPSSGNLEIKLKPNKKIISALREKTNNIIIGFKAEHDVSTKELIKRAHASLEKNNANLVVANDVGKKMRGFGGNTNEVYIVDDKGGVKHLPLAKKEEIAKGIADKISSLFA